MYFNPKLRIGFLHIPKTGGTFVGLWLRKVFGENEIVKLSYDSDTKPVVVPLRNTAGFSPHSTYRWLVDNFPEFRLPTARIYSLIRNPFSHSVSLYRQQFRFGRDCEDSYDEHMRKFRNGLSKKLADSGGNIPAVNIHVHKLENLDQLLSDILCYAGMPKSKDPNLHPVNVALQIESVLTVGTYDAVVDDYSRWFDYGGYDRYTIPDDLERSPDLDDHIAKLKEEADASKTITQRRLRSWRNS